MSGPYYLNPNGTFPLRAGDGKPLLIDAAEHERLCCRWQGRVMYEAKGSCAGGVWDTTGAGLGWQVVLDGGAEVYGCVKLNNSDPCDDTPVETPGTIETIGGGLQCGTHFEVGSVVWVYGNVHEGDVECNYANASQGVSAPTDGITGWVYDVYEVEIIVCNMVSGGECVEAGREEASDASLGRWECESRAYGDGEVFPCVPDDFEPFCYDGAEYTYLRTECPP